MNVYELFQRKSGRCCRKDKRIGKLRSPDIRDRPAHVPFYCTDPDRPRFMLCAGRGHAGFRHGLLLARRGCFHDSDRQQDRHGSDKDEKPAADTCHQLFSRLRGNNRRAGSAGACRNRPAYQQLCSPCDGRRRRRLVSVSMHVPHSHRSESPLDSHCRICHRFRTCDIHRP